MAEGRPWHRPGPGHSVSAPVTLKSDIDINRFFIGDTPESDIRGTNEFNDSEKSENTWFSILVRTGVFKEGTKPRYMPKMTVDNVLEAVKYGMEREQVRAIKEKTINAPPVECAIEE